MLYFSNDYSEGAHPKILENLIKTNFVPQVGYGDDSFCLSAAEKIRAACGCPNTVVRFLVGGTQTNQIIIDALCESWEGVISASTGHVNSHEAGAIEYTGHKVITLPHHDGKISSDELKSYLSDFLADSNNEHMVRPGAVYISHPTEYGTLYTKSELFSISSVCREFSIPLYLDGARLGYALASDENDLTLSDIAELCDVFYIGGTKVGALCGEAVVFTKNNAPKHFTSIIKQHGALLAKGRLLGVQFDTLFTDDLYTEISRNAIKTAAKLKSALKEKGYELFIDSPTNQIFIIMDNEKLKKLAEKVVLSTWEKLDESRTVIRIATSWATTEDSVDEFIRIL